MLIPWWILISRWNPTACRVCLCDIAVACTHTTTLCMLVHLWNFTGISSFTESHGKFLDVSGRKVWGGTSKAETSDYPTWSGWGMAVLGFLCRWVSLRWKNLKRYFWWKNVYFLWTHAGHESINVHSNMIFSNMFMYFTGIECLTKMLILVNTDPASIV